MEWIIWHEEIKQRGNSHTIVDCDSSNYKSQLLHLLDFLFFALSMRYKKITDRSLWKILFALFRTRWEFWLFCPINWCAKNYKPQFMKMDCNYWQLLVNFKFLMGFFIGIKRGSVPFVPKHSLPLKNIS
jgi:hypothetical protein